MKGAGGFGFSAMEAMEVDPVRRGFLRAWLTPERYRLGPVHYQGNESEAGEEIPASHFGTYCTQNRSVADMKEPSPADIRPLPVLKQTLQLLKRKWKENHNYAYAVDQFKSMRQDLTVSLCVRMEPCIWELSRCIADIRCNESRTNSQ